MNLLKLKIIVFFYIICVITIVISCSSKQEKILTDFNSFINEIETNIKTNNINELKWDEYELKYNQLINDYELQKENLSESQREIINSNIGKYKAIIVKREVNEVKNQINDVKNQIEGFIEEAKK